APQLLEQVYAVRLRRALVEPDDVENAVTYGEHDIRRGGARGDLMARLLQSSANRKRYVVIVFHQKHTQGTAHRESRHLDHHGIGDRGLQAQRSSYTASITSR